MKWEDVVVLSTITHMESYCFLLLERPTPKSILMASHFDVGTLIIWVRQPGLRCSALTCWQLGYLATYSTMSLFIPSYQYICLRLWYILVEPGCMEYLELWASATILVRKSSICGTHSLSWKYVIISQNKTLIHFNQHWFLQLHQHMIKMLTLLDFNY